MSLQSVVEGLELMPQDFDEGKMLDVGHFSRYLREGFPTVVEGAVERFRCLWEEFVDQVLVGACSLWLFGFFVVLCDWLCTEAAPEGHKLELCERVDLFQ